MVATTVSTVATVVSTIVVVDSTIVEVVVGVFVVVVVVSLVVVGVLVVVTNSSAEVVKVSTTSTLREVSVSAPFALQHMIMNRADVSAIAIVPPIRELRTRDEIFISITFTFLNVKKFLCEC